MSHQDPAAWFHLALSAVTCVFLSFPAVVLRAAGASSEASTNAGMARLPGNLWVHDPSTMVKSGGEYWFFATGRGIGSRHSKDLINWESGPRVFTAPPAWTARAVPGNRGFFWAPDIIWVGGTYRLYYSVSTWGSPVSAIGMASNSTLDPANPKFHWEDGGIVISSSEKDGFNAIDPSVMLDSKGRLWMAFGSYWSGIKIIQLDPRTGLRLDSNSAPAAVAWKLAIEAASILEHEGRFYLFVNWGQCCRGVKSTYNIRVGRSDNVLGPYLDKAGINMLDGGGTLFLETDGPRIGPGHAGFLSDGPLERVSFHYYDAERHGAATLGLGLVHWRTDGWPQFEQGSAPIRN